MKELRRTTTSLIFNVASVGPVFFIPPINIVDTNLSQFIEISISLCDRTFSVKNLMRS
jgi:hypothetical protein